MSLLMALENPFENSRKQLLKSAAILVHDENIHKMLRHLMRELRVAVDIRIAAYFVAIERGVFIMNERGWI
ncbi:MAG: hypothetical protein H5T43_02470 [Methanomethylovorans sp.]|nr:hypothetical protein [Methanomethylovorans sp.]